MFGLFKSRKSASDAPAALVVPAPAPGAEHVLRRLEWTVIRRLDGLLQGDYRTLMRGSGLDLAIAIGFLAAHGQVPVSQIEGLGFVGELGLDGSLRQIAGVAPMVAAMGDVRPVVPFGNYREAWCVAGDGVRVAHTLREVVDG